MAIEEGPSYSALLLTSVLGNSHSIATWSGGKSL